MSDTIDLIIKGRKSIYPKFFTDESIDKKEVLSLLEYANWAPTHRLTQPWRFAFIEGEKKKELALFLAESYKNTVDPTRFNARKYEEKKKKVLESPIVLAIIMQRDPKASVPEWEELAATAMAVQNFWMAATAKGYGGYWSSPKALIGQPEIFPLEEGQHCYGLFYLGKHNMPEIPRQRTPMEDKIDSWS